MKVAYLCEPQIGGTFTFFLRLREGARGDGVDVRCIPPVSAELLAGTRFEKYDGVEAVSFPSDLAAATVHLRDHLLAEKYDVVVILPGCDLLTTNLVRYLPHALRTAARIPMATRGAYRPVPPVAAHLDRVICVCDRIRDDLVAEYRVPRDRTAIIYNGADIVRFHPRGRRDPGSSGLRLIYSGRLEDVQKNVMMLPRLMKQLRARVPGAHLTVVGNGPDGERLKQALEKACPGAADVVFGVKNSDLPDRYRDADIFVFPTRFEGSPNAMLEAMASGCVPVVSNLPGCTDVIVRDGVDGFLCRLDDVRAFADRIERLSQDPALLPRMSGAARARIESAFTQERMVASYLKLFREMVAAPSRRASPLPVEAYEVPTGLRRGWRALIPSSVKKRVRTVLGRLGKSV